MTAIVGDASAAMAPGLMRRMASFMYEGVLLFGIGLIPGAIGALFLALTEQQHPLQGELALQTISLMIYAVYFTWFWSTRGETLPMKTWHIRVVTAEGEPLSQARALARFVASCAWVAPAVLIAHLNGWSPRAEFAAVAVGIVGYALLALLHPQRQFWHDALCGTRLVDSRPVSRSPLTPV